MSINHRILVVDDMPSIHEDFRKILLRGQGMASLADDEAFLFGTATDAASTHDDFEIDSAFQGREALEMVERAREAGRPYAMAIVDMRMPPGWDGIETVQQLWLKEPQLQVVICTAYSDVSWEDTLDRLATHDRLIILHKPFEAQEAVELVRSMTKKWNDEAHKKRPPDG